MTKELLFPTLTLSFILSFILCGLIVACGHSGDKKAGESGAASQSALMGRFRFSQKDCPNKPKPYFTDQDLIKINGPGSYTELDFNAGFMIITQFSGSDQCLTTQKFSLSQESLLLKTTLQDTTASPQCNPVTRAEYEKLKAEGLSEEDAYEVTASTLKVTNLDKCVASYLRQ